MSVLLALGCAAAGDDAECHQDVDCASGSACFAGACVARVGAEPAIWSLQVTPGAQPNHALREFPGFAFTGQSADLVVDRRISMATVLSAMPAAPTLDGKTSVHVVLSAPSTIPGRSELQFEADGSTGSSSDYEVSVPLPARFVGVPARMSVVPAAPLDRSMPPWVLPVILDSVLLQELPGPLDTLKLEGKLERADTQAGPDSGYQARLLVAGRLVSNVPLIDAAGGFVLRLQKSALPAGGAGLALELGPADATAALPSLLATIDASKGTLDRLRLPVFGKPEPHVVPVLGGPDRVPVVGATVSFKTTVAGASGGRAVYVRSAQTGGDGKAALALIPGTAQLAREYSVKITPPGNSEYAARCVPSYTIGAAAGGGPHFGVAIELAPKVLLEGRVVRADGAPAASVRIRPTRIGDVYAGACGGDLVSAPAEATTGPDGRYRLRLDPGEYQIDCEPPQGAPLPATSVLVTVPAAKTLDVALPLAVLIEGRVRAPDDAPIAAAEVRAFGPGPSGSVQTRGVALSDAEGKFRMILPRHP